MNGISFWSIVLFGFIFGFIFRELLIAAGVDKKFAKSIYSIAIPPVFALVCVFAFGLFLRGALVMNDPRVLTDFAGGIYVWLTVALAAGGFGRIAFDMLKTIQVQPPKPASVAKASSAPEQQASAPATQTSSS